jgi:hypothetical protein
MKRFNFANLSSSVIKLLVIFLSNGLVLIMPVTAIVTVFISGPPCIDTGP